MPEHIEDTLTVRAIAVAEVCESISTLSGQRPGDVAESRTAVADAPVVKRLHHITTPLRQHIVDA